MIIRTMRRALLLAIATVAVMAAPASATHYQCSGLQDPNCNNQYIYDHSVDPLVTQTDPVKQAVDDVRRDISNRVNCRNTGYEFPECHYAELAERINGLRGTVMDLVDGVYNRVGAAARAVLCEYAGAC